MNEHPLKDGNKRREKRRGGERERKAKEKSGEGEYSQVRCTAPPNSTVAVPKVPGIRDTCITITMQYTAGYTLKINNTLYTQVYTSYNNIYIKYT